MRDEPAGAKFFGNPNRVNSFGFGHQKKAAQMLAKSQERRKVNKNALTELSESEF